MIMKATNPNKPDKNMGWIPLTPIEDENLKKRFNRMLKNQVLPPNKNTAVSGFRNSD